MWFLFPFVILHHFCHVISQPPQYSVGERAKHFGSCLPIRKDDLGPYEAHGRTYTPEKRGLVVSQLLLEAQERAPEETIIPVPTVLIQSMRVTCQAPTARTRSARYASTSVLVAYTCSGVACYNSIDSNPTNANNYIHFFYFQCGVGNTWQIYSQSRLSHIYHNHGLDGLLEAPLASDAPGLCSVCANVQENFNGFDLDADIDWDHQCLSK